MNNNEMSVMEKSIVFIGFMGVGKTTIGQLVAKKLSRDFVDTDKVIENEFGMPIPQIFEKLGEKTFRNKEKEIITAMSEQPLKVISVGGGAFLQKEIQDVCMKNCIVYYLDVSWESWKERINILIDSRPVLQGLSLEETKELFEKRKDSYSVHHSKFTTDDLAIEEIADKIVESLKLNW